MLFASLPVQETHSCIPRGSQFSRIQPMQKCFWLFSHVSTGKWFPPFTGHLQDAKSTGVVLYQNPPAFAPACFTDLVCLFSSWFPVLSLHLSTLPLHAAFPLPSCAVPSSGAAFPKLSTSLWLYFQLSINHPFFPFSIWTSSFLHPAAVVFILCNCIRCFSLDREGFILLSQRYKSQVHWSSWSTPL